MVSDKAVDTASLQSLILSLREKPESDARASFKELLNEAAQPRHVSGNACIKLCYFLEQCRKSDSSSLLNLAYSRETCQDLFDFYVEWAEKNQHRSMRQVLELLAVLISQNPHDAVKTTFKVKSLDRLVGIVRHQAAQPLVKPAFKVLDYFLSKRTISIEELVAAYKGSRSELEVVSQQQADDTSAEGTAKSLGQFVTDVFEWMALPDTASSAGKLIVCLFTAIKKTSAELAGSKYASWQNLIQDGLAKYPESLDHVKNYIFLDLFKIDKAESLKFLKALSGEDDETAVRVKRESSSEDNERGDNQKKPEVNASLLLSAMEVGKKLGLVDEPDIIPPKKVPAKKREFVELPSKLIGDYLVDTQTTVRASAFTILVSSLSSIKPYPTESLEAIKKNLAYLHADTDAKFRNELFTNTKYMLERLKGAIALLIKEIALLPEEIAVKTEDAVKKEDVVMADVEDDSDDEAKKPKKPLTVKETLQKHLEEHKAFLKWYLEFLEYELIPTASYQRHVTSLKALEIALKTGLQECPTSITTPTSGPDSTWRETIVFTPILVRLLLDLLLDPFEEVRNCSANVLNYAPKDCFGHPVSALYECGTTPKYLSELAAKAREASAKTGRADFADGLAHAYVLQFKFFDTNAVRQKFFDGLLSKLEEDIETAAKDLETAASKAPVHGQFATIRQLWERMSATEGSELETLQKLQRRLAACCVKTWDTVKEILTNDSPEGHVPATSTETGDVDIKGILSYSFRACHESSLLVQSIIRKLNTKTADGKTFLPVSIFAELGNLTFEQLSTLRHRGAFSTVALTFTQCCRATQNEAIMEEGGSKLLNSWYCGALACIEEQHSTTRRSAGIPALITGILSASSKELTFDSIMQTLMSMARVPVVESDKDEVQLSQVHAMNSLKDVFKSATLGRKADSYITDCFQIAADSMKSNIWAISNCGLLLVKSLIDCMLGTSESKAATEAGWDGRSIRISYDRYPQLPDLLLRLLNSTDAKEIFPALEFLRRVGPPEGRSELKEQFFAGVVIHLDSNTWDVRDLAARTAATFLLHDDWYEVIEYLVNFYATPKQCSTNGMHGTFSLIKSLIQKRNDLNVSTSSEQLIKLLELLGTVQIDPKVPTDMILAATRLEAQMAINSLFAKQNPETRDLPSWNRLPLHTLAKNARLTDGRDDKKAALTRTRVSYAKAMAASVVQLALTHIERHPLETLEELALIEFHPDCDEDVVVATLELFDDVKLQGTNAYGVLMFCIKFVEKWWPSRVQTAAMMNIARILHHLDADTVSEGHMEVLKEALDAPQFLDTDPEHLERDDEKKTIGGVISGPELTNARLYAKGGILRLTAVNSDGTVDNKKSKLIRQFATEVSWAVEEDEIDFYAREAAMLAADSFFSFQVSDKRELKNDPRFYIENAVLSALSDDDNDIRLQAAKVVAKITGRDVVPEAAVSIFCLWLLDKYADQLGEDPIDEHEPIWHDGFYNAVKQGVEYPRTRRPGHPGYGVSSQLYNAMEEDNSLFVEESQNLYIDEVQQTRQWLGFMKDDPKFRLLWLCHQILEDNIKDDMKALWEMVEQKYDGPFGWTSKPETFGVVMRAILAAQTFCKMTDDWDPEGTRHDSWGENYNALCETLCGMMWTQGKKQELHPLIMKELEFLRSHYCDEHRKWKCDRSGEEMSLENIKASLEELYENELEDWREMEEDTIAMLRRYGLEDQNERDGSDDDSEDGWGGGLRG